MAGASGHHLNHQRLCLHQKGLEERKEKSEKVGGVEESYKQPGKSEQLTENVQPKQ